MVRIALKVQYNGSNFSGWQSQIGRRTVQSSLEDALSFVADEHIKVVCAGRTDAGVHSTGQIVHFDTSAVRTDYSWVFGTNTKLPPDISIQWARFVPETFHARFSAISRSYRYLVHNEPIRSALYHKRATWEHRKLNITLMQSATKYWIGRHDFSSFQAKGCQASSPVREIMAFDISREGDLIVFSIKANAFLQHMIRNFAGVLFDIGCRKRAASWANEVLLYKNRSLGGITAEPDGLYLADVGYPKEFSRYTESQ
jgi:tRNA pseudouridine38-40 synthase